MGNVLGLDLVYWHDSIGVSELAVGSGKTFAYLGASGAIGTVRALLAAYLIYPWFLAGTKPQTGGSGVTGGGTRRFVLARYSGSITLAFVGTCLFLGLGIFRLNPDPSGWFRWAYWG